MRLIIIAITCTTLGFAVAYLILPSLKDAKSEPTGAGGQLYTCGMHPEIISEEPGICPICNMKLTPKRDASDREGAVQIDPSTKQNMGLVTAQATYRDLSRTINAFGKVTVPEPNVHRVTFKTEGWIERLLVSEEGERVLQGQPLLEIYSPDLVAAQKELLVTLESSSSASLERLSKAARQRLQNWDISEDQLARLKETGEVNRTMIIRSPVDGIVRIKNVTEGDRVSSHSVLYEIVDLTNVWIEAQVYEQDLPHVRIGQTAHISIPGLPGQTFKGRVDFLSPLLDDRGQAEVRLTLDNPEYRLKPEMYAEVTIESAPSKERLTIPRSAVINSGVRQLVFVAEDEDSYEPRAVVTGVVGGEDMVEIVEGLAEGEAVVVSGQFLLDSETRLNEAIGIVKSHTNGHRTDKERGESTSDLYDIHTCPMPIHYHVLNYGPGECSECGMDLVPVSKTDNAPVYVCPVPGCGPPMKEPGDCSHCNMTLVEYVPGGTDDK